MKKKDTIQVGVRLPVHLCEFVDTEAEERGVDRSVVIIDALNERKKLKNPIAVTDLFRRALREDPGIVAEVAEAVHIYEHQNPLKKPRG